MRSLKTRFRKLWFIGLGAVQLIEQVPVRWVLIVHIHSATLPTDACLAHVPRMPGIRTTAAWHAGTKTLL